MPEPQVLSQSLVDYRRCLLAAGLLLIAIGSTVGRELQQDEPPFEYLCRTWKRDAGLPHNEVKALLQTRDGYLWAGTRAGLARFDGVKFTIVNRANQPALVSDDCTALAEDNDGSLWVGTMKGVVHLTHRDVRHYSMADGLPDNRIWTLCASRRGGVWIGTDSGLAFLHAGKLVVYENGMRHGHVFSLYEAEAGVLWIGTARGLHRLEIDSGVIIPLGPAGPVFALASSAGALYGICAESLTEPGRLYHFQNELWFRYNEPQVNSFGAFCVRDCAGGLLFPSAKGICRFVDDHFTRLALPSALSNLHFQCAIKDRENNLWLGSTEGLHRLSRSQVVTYSTNNGLPHDDTWTIHEDRHGRVWIGSAGGLSRLEEGCFTHFNQDRGLIHNFVYALAEDSQGGFWIGTRSGLDRFENGQFTHHRFPGEWFQTKVRALHAGRDGAVWVGAARGLHRIHNGQRSFWTATNGLANSDVRAILEDRAGVIWVGTYGGGLHRFDEGRFQIFNTTHGLSSDYIWAFHEDDTGVLWIGSERGLTRHEQGRFTTFTTREGLPDDLVNYILEDQLGNLWISHNRGIYRVQKAELNAVAALKAAKAVRCVSYDESDGLLSIETNGQKSQPAGCRTRDGRLWFPTTKGVVVFDPRQLPDNTYPPPVLIEQIRANGETIFNNYLHAELSAATKLAPGSTHILEIEYAAPSFVAPEALQFKYRLDGLDRDWVEAGTRRAAYYANLRPGHYNFRVIAGNKYGIWNETGAAFQFYLAPYLHQTWTFRATCGAGLGAVVLGLFGWRLHYVRRIHRLEEQRDRARIARDLHDDFGAQLTRLTLLADVSDAPNEAKIIEDRLREIARVTRETATKLREIVWVNHPGDETLEGLAARVCQHAQDFLAAANIRCRLEVAENLPVRPLRVQARHNLYLAAKESLHNIAKHSSATEARIRVTMQDSVLNMTIEDNGRGFTPGKSGQKTEGRGLENMRARMESLGGKLSLSSEAGKGTIIRMQAPLKGLFQS